MSLAQLVYTSSRDPSLTAIQIRQITEHAAEDNRRNGISGILMVCGESIMQLIEGELVDVMNLFERIRRDGR